MRSAIWRAHDRIGDSTLPLTHEFPALMLGVRRAGVTEALHSLKPTGVGDGPWSGSVPAFLFCAQADKGQDKAQREGNV